MASRMSYTYPFTNMPGPGDPETWGPCTNHPGDPRTPDLTDSPAFEDKCEELTIDRIQDVEGAFLESFTEATPEQLAELSEAVLLPADEESSIRIGDIVRQLVEDYCEPTDEQVLEKLNQEPDE